MSSISVIGLGSRSLLPEKRSTERFTSCWCSLQKVTKGSKLRMIKECVLYIGLLQEHNKDARRCDEASSSYSRVSLITPFHLVGQNCAVPSQRRALEYC